MTEQPPASLPEDSADPSEALEERSEPTQQPTGEPTGEPTSTGVPAVDQVLRDVDDLDGVPLEEHLGRFERAHETLRSALDAEQVGPVEPGDPA